MKRLFILISLLVLLILLSFESSCGNATSTPSPVITAPNTTEKLFGASSNQQNPGSLEKLAEMLEMNNTGTSDFNEIQNFSLFQFGKVHTEDQYFVLFA